MDLKFPLDYKTTGEDTIWSIILQYYGIEQYVNPDKAKSAYDQIARANTHIVSMETLTVGDVLNLPTLDSEEGNTPTQQLKAAAKKKAASSDQEID